MTLVIVSVRERNGSPIWSQQMDRDSAYFQDFRRNMEADLANGQSITITPLEDAEAKIEEGLATSCRWDTV